MSKSVTEDTQASLFFTPEYILILAGVRRMTAAAPQRLAGPGVLVILPHWMQVGFVSVVALQAQSHLLRLVQQLEVVRRMHLVADGAVLSRRLMSVCPLKGHPLMAGETEPIARFPQEVAAES